MCAHSSYNGPEYSLGQIFGKAREEAPCYLVFEDLDSIVSDNVRSYFLNEVDGLKSNDGILMVGSTNHLDRLDPGISKRPSRFDRKYYFSNPDYAQRVQYSKFWQGKLADNKDLDFPDKLCEKIAEITDKFSFAYMQEAFIASLLAIATRGGKDKVEAEMEALRWAGPQDPMRPIDSQFRVMVGGGDDSDVKHLELWIEMQKQVKILKDEMEEKKLSERMETLLQRPSKGGNSENPTRHRDELDAMLHERRDDPMSLLGDAIKRFM